MQETVIIALGLLLTTCHGFLRACPSFLQSCEVKVQKKSLYGDARHGFPSPYLSSALGERASDSVALPLVSRTKSDLGKPEDTVNEGTKGVTLILYDLYLMI